MSPEVGHFALTLALGVSAVQAFAGLFGGLRRQPQWMHLSRVASVGQFGFVLLSFLVLALGFLQNDFSLLYVAQNSNTALPVFYKFAAVWGAHEGSLLLWILILSGWTVMLTWRNPEPRDSFIATALGVLGVVSVGFMLFTLLTSNPFERLDFPPMNGRDLNPILQDPALVIHPPMLYFGYVGFSIPFALAIAALFHFADDTSWAKRARPWAAAAWLFLTFGITLGSWWAYYELGWGGWWFWDPVENASFMPWLVGTALLHSLAVTDQRKSFVSWTILLAIATFSLSLLGTFLVRSGVLVSVHAFASDPARGVFILLFMTIIVGSALAIYGWRAGRLPVGSGFAMWSRESLLLLNNVLLTTAAASVMLGTLYPLLLDALNAGKISVGPPYFNAIFVPLMLPILLFVAFGPVSSWKRADWRAGLRQLAGLGVVSMALALIAIAWFSAHRSFSVSLGIVLACWALFTAGSDLLKRKSTGSSMPLRIWGMSLAHAGIGVTALGIAVSSGFSMERDASFAIGESVMLGQYEFTLDDVHDINGPNYSGVSAKISVHVDGEQVALLDTQKRVYLVQQSAMTEAGIDASLWRDLYVALGDPLGEGRWSARVQYKPLVRFIWLGGLMMVLGGLLAVFDRRNRNSHGNRQEAGEVTTA